MFVCENFKKKEADHIKSNQLFCKKNDQKEDNAGQTVLSLIQIS